MCEAWRALICSAATGWLASCWVPLAGASCRWLAGCVLLRAAPCLQPYSVSGPLSIWLPHSDPSHAPRLPFGAYGLISSQAMDTARFTYQMSGCAAKQRANRSLYLLAEIRARMFSVPYVMNRATASAGTSHRSRPRWPTGRATSLPTPIRIRRCRSHSDGVWTRAPTNCSPHHGYVCMYVCI
eukprot:SAG11_NODE_1030_length_6119_cov_7.559302_7_plen_183_part_00